MTPDAALRRLADAQLGLVHRSQLADFDLSPTQVYKRVRNGTLERLAPDVFRIAGAGTNGRQRVLAAVLDAGPTAAASHRTAAALWGLTGYRLEPIEVSRSSQGNRRRSNLAVIHEPLILEPGHVVSQGPLRVVTPALVLFQLAACVHPLRLEHAVDQAIAERLTNCRALHAMLDLLAERGRGGTRPMRAVLDVRPPDYRPVESRLEWRVQQILTEAGFPMPERQVDVGDGDGWIGRVDFLFRAARLILFVDGSRWHTMITDRLADEVQRQRLARAGFAVERVTESMVFRQPAEVIATVAPYLRRLRSAG